MYGRGRFLHPCFLYWASTLIGLYIQYFANSSAYGAAGSLIVILTWIYYTCCYIIYRCRIYTGLCRGHAEAG